MREIKLLWLLELLPELSPERPEPKGGGPAGAFFGTLPTPGCPVGEGATRRRKRSAKYS